jgi:hypothetical protein
MRAAEDGLNGESLVDLEARSTPLTEASASEAMTVDVGLNVVVMIDQKLSEVSKFARRAKSGMKLKNSFHPFTINNNTNTRSERYIAQNRQELFSLFMRP